MRSVDALFVPVGALGLGGLVMVGMYAGVERWQRGGRRARLLTGVLWAMGSVGAALAGLAVVAVFRPLPFRMPFLFAPLSLVTGVLPLSLAIRLRAGRGERRPRSRVAMAYGVPAGLLVIIGLFWASSDYARALGRGRAQLLHAALPVRPGVVVYSAQQLYLEGPGVVETRLTDGDSDFRYRYTGLRLLTKAGGRLFILPTQWSVTDGRAIILSDDERVRVEFTVGASS